MKKSAFLSLGIVLAIASGCSEDTICECIETGKKLDVKAQEILSEGATESRSQELKALKEEKAIKCREFERMDGQQMLKRMEDCDLNGQ